MSCGTGDVLRSLRPRYGLGLDFSETMIKSARSRHAACANLEFKVGDAESLPQGALYAAVILPDLLEHVPDWCAVLSEAAGRVKRGGRLALSTPSPLWAPAMFVLERLRLKTPEGPHRFVRLTAIVWHLRGLGMTVVDASNHLLVPKDLGRATAWLNESFTRVPLLRRFGLIQFAVAVRRER